jgi:hypothetical protein
MRNKEGSVSILNHTGAFWVESISGWGSFGPHL